LRSSNHFSEAREFDRKLREEQDKAYQESLIRDQEREQQTKIEQDRAREERLFHQLSEEMENYQKEVKLRELEKKVQNLPPEPSESDSKGTTVAVRLPDGSKIQRRFWITDTIGVSRSEIVYLPK
jgi:FAS-associated factor 2